MRDTIIVWLLVLGILAVSVVDARKHHKRPRHSALPDEDEEDERAEVSPGEEQGKPAEQTQPAPENTHKHHTPKPGKGRLHWKKHKPVDESTDTVYKKEWERITQYHKTDNSACAQLKCRRKQICLINANTGTAECVRKRFLEQEWKRLQALSQEEREEEQEVKPKKKVLHHHHRRPGKTNTATHYDDIGVKNRYMKVAYDYRDGTYKKYEEVRPSKKHNNVMEVKGGKECSRHDLDEMGRRLLDWFKLLQDDHQRRTKHHKSKRNSHKKELRYGDCGCLAPVSWEFNQLDINSDGHLSTGELVDIENNGYEHCVTPFINGCDKNLDYQLSEREWCCCFSSILPPCLSAQKKMEPFEENDGPASGKYVPDCDMDGFYKSEQCHNSVGQCWCVDRNGHEIPQSRVRGRATCKAAYDHFMAYAEDQQ